MPEHIKPGSSLRPVLFAALFIPMGITTGYIQVALAYLLAKTGVSVGAIAGFVGLCLLPSVWRAAWARWLGT